MPIDKEMSGGLPMWNPDRSWLERGCYTERKVQQGDRDASDIQRQRRVTRMKPRLCLSLVRRIDLG